MPLPEVPSTGAAPLSPSKIGFANEEDRLEMLRQAEEEVARRVEARVAFACPPPPPGPGPIEWDGPSQAHSLGALAARPLTPGLPTGPSFCFWTAVRGARVQAEGDTVRLEGTLLWRQPSGSTMRRSELRAAHPTRTTAQLCICFVGPQTPPHFALVGAPDCAPQRPALSSHIWKACAVFLEECVQ
jgi:hypothetical protein